MKIGQHETHPAADVFPLMNGAEFEDLKRSIMERGQEDPIMLVMAPEDSKGRPKALILDGRNRYRACIDLGAEPFFRVWGGEDPWEYVWATNGARRHLEPGHRVAIRLKLDKVKLAELAEQRKLEGDRARAEAAKGRKRKGGRFEDAPADQSVTELSPTGGEERKTRSALAKRTGTSSATAQKAITLEKKAPEVFAQVVAGDVSLELAHRKFQKEQALAQLRSEPTPLPDGRFRCIVADPPWPYEVRNEDPSHRGAIPYHSMTIADICAMPVELRAHSEGCVLFLWTTNAFLEHAPQVVRSWGFDWKTVLTWKKPRMGVGNILRGITEHCIVAVRGKPVIGEASASATTFLEAPNPTGEHSDKPEEFYALVEGLCPGSKLELFAREARPGWTVWGSEVDGIVQRDGVKAQRHLVDADELGAAMQKAMAEEGGEPMFPGVVVTGNSLPAKRTMVVFDEVQDEPRDLLARASADLDTVSNQPSVTLSIGSAEENLPRMDDGDWMGSPAGSKVGRPVVPMTKDEVAQLTPEQVEEEWKAAKASEARNQAARRKGKRKAKA